MRTLTYFVATTVDGCIAGPNGEHDFFPFQGDHMTALFEDFPETIPTHVREALGQPTRRKHFDLVLMGRNTYEPARALGIEAPYAPLETIVFSRTLPVRSEGYLRITADDPCTTVRALKRKEGAGIWLCGGGQLAGELADEIDRLVVKVNPVLGGNGIRLLDGAFQPRKLALRAQRAFESGVVVLSYDVLRET